MTDTSTILHTREGSPLTAHVRNFKAIRAADLDFDRGVVVVSAPNARGKTSICEAIRCALLQNALAFELGEDDIDKKEAALLVHQYEKGKTGSVSLVAPGPTRVDVTWPLCEVTTRGVDYPKASAAAVGMSFSLPPLVPAKERGKLLVRMLKAEVTKERFTAAVEECGFKWVKRGETDRVHMADDVWQAIQDAGWEAAHKRVTDRRKGFRSAWEDTAGEMWGAAKAEGWRPKNYQPEWDGITVEQARAEHEEKFQAFQAVVAEIGQLDARIGLAGKLAAHEQSVADWAAKVAIAERNYETAKGLVHAPTRTREAMPKEDACPHCGGKLAVHPNQTVTIPKTPEEQSAPEKEAGLTLGKQKSVYEAAVYQLEGSRSLVSQSKVAQARLDKEGITLDGLYLKRNTLAGESDETKARAEAIEKVATCAIAHGQLKKWAKLADVLDESGLRREVMLEKLGQFNELLRDISATIGAAGKDGKRRLEDVQIDLKSHATTIGDKPFMLSSGTERFAALTALQIATAKLDGSSLIVVDWDTASTPDWCERVCKSIMEQGLRAVVTFVFRSVKLAPPTFAQARSYWLNSDGSCREVPPWGGQTQREEAKARQDSASA